jgi:hypothetical protein
MFKLLTKDRMAVNFAKLPELLRKPISNRVGSKEIGNDDAIHTQNPGRSANVSRRLPRRNGGRG